MKKLLLLSLSLFLAPSLAFGAVFSHSMGVGYSGTDVSSLQQFLADEGLYSGPITASFGPMTRAAVSSFQAQESISPATGYFGALTRADANAIMDAHPSWETTLSSGRYYTNASGSAVHSPSASSNGIPAGATAECRDGTYSFSLHRSGSCSHHGGVESWL